MRDETSIRNGLRQWLATKTERNSARQIEDGTALISEGILKSIHVLDLILWIEEERERPVEVQRIRPGAFASIDAIYSSFFSEEEHHAA